MGGGSHLPHPTIFFKNPPIKTNACPHPLPPPPPLKNKVPHLKNKPSIET